MRRTRHNCCDMLKAKRSTHGRVEAPIEGSQALILAGGLGKRLRAAFDTGPKSMAPVGDRRFLEYLLVWLRSAGIKDLILCVGYRKNQIQSWLRDGSDWGLRIRYSEEKRLLGTAGALKQAEEMLSTQNCLVINGDSFLDVDLRKMYRFHQRHDALATIAIARVRNSARYGTVQLDRSEKIVAFQEKRKNITTSGRSLSPAGMQLINGGVYLFQRRFFDSIPARRATSLEKEIFPRLVGGDLYGFVSCGYFIDIGVPSDFERAQTELRKRFRG
jgi:NDP-sugar pyrophosphorylase family protein